jgi:UDPglucose 6-dehydrogenase
MKISIAGTGYVGLSNVMPLSQHYEIIALDIIPEKIE